MDNTPPLPPPRPGLRLPPSFVYHEEGGDANSEVPPSPAVPAKRRAPASARPSRPAPALVDVSLPTLLSLSPAEMKGLPKDQLLGFLILAQGELKACSPALDNLADKVEHQRRLMVNGIRAQLVWKTACKSGHAGFTHELLDLDQATFAGVFNLALPIKKKRFALTADEFEDACGELGVPSAPVRYATLVPIGEVSVRWNEDDGTATVHGGYGKDLGPFGR